MALVDSSAKVAIASNPKNARHSTAAPENNPLISLVVNTKGLNNASVLRSTLVKARTTNSVIKINCTKISKKLTELINLIPK